MIKKLFSGIVILFYLTSSGQDMLKVSYEKVHTTKVDFNGIPVSDFEREEILKQLSKKIKTSFVLYYDKGNSYFTDSKKEISFYKKSGENGAYSLNQMDEEDYYYGYYPNDNREIEYTDITEKIENYTCKVALLKTDSGNVKIWYTEEIPLPIGPYKYTDFPGLVLKVEGNNLLIYATSISKDNTIDAIPKMNPSIKVYEGEELEQKNKEARQIMIMNGRKKAEKIKQKLNKMYN